MVKMQSTYVLLCLLPLVKGDRETAFNIKSLSCSGNSATLEYASCGFENADPCTVGEGVTLKGTYTVNDSVPQTVQACGAIQIFGIGVYDAGCQQNVDICDYMDCSNTGTDGYLDSNGSPYEFDINLKKIPGNNGWFGSGYGLGFSVTFSDDGKQVEKCKVKVSTTTISSSAAVVAVASLCTLAVGLYYRRKRRTGTIDLEKEEGLVQTDFVELSETGVSV